MEFLELIKTIQGAIPAEYAWVSTMISNVFPWIACAVAVLLCFFGYKVQQVWATVLFFGMGVIVGVMIGAVLTTVFPGLNTWIALAPPLVLGVLGAVFAPRLRKLQHFLVNATLVYASLPGILARWLDEPAVTILALIAALIAGILAAKYKYIVTIFTTAVTGGVAIAPQILGLFQASGMPLLLGVEVVLIAAGITNQFFIKRHELRRAKSKDKARA